MNLKTTVVIDFEIEGFHRYPGAPQRVSFLRHSHRHLFQFKVHIRVTDLNREKEIFLVQAEIKDYIIDRYGYGPKALNWPVQFDERSCEMIATELIKKFHKSLNVHKVEVFEDGKGGAYVEL